MKLDIRTEPEKAKTNVKGLVLLNLSVILLLVSYVMTSV